MFIILYQNTSVLVYTTRRGIFQRDYFCVLVMSAVVINATLLSQR